MIGNKQQILSFLQGKDESDIFEISKKQEKSLRSSLQLKYYWGVIIDIIWDFHWYSPLETNEMLKATFGVNTFTNLDTKEFKELIENIIDIWKVKYNVKIPLPNETKDFESLTKYLF